MDSATMKKLASRIADLAEELGDHEAEITGRVLEFLASSREEILASVGFEADGPTPVLHGPWWGYLPGRVKVWHLWMSSSAQEPECQEIEREDKLITFCSPSDPESTCQTCQSLEKCDHGLCLSGPCVQCGRADPLDSPRPERTPVEVAPVEVAPVDVAPVEVAPVEAPVKRRRRKAQATLFEPATVAQKVEVAPVEAPIESCRNGHLFIGAEPCSRCGESPWADSEVVQPPVAPPGKVPVVVPVEVAQGEKRLAIGDSCGCVSPRYFQGGTCTRCGKAEPTDPASGVRS